MSLQSLPAGGGGDARHALALMVVEPDLVLFHATSRALLPQIKAGGLNAGSYFSTLKVAQYYASALEDEGQEAVILSVPFAALDRSSLLPDGPGIAEPITTAIGRSGEDVQGEWAAVEGTWEDSLRVIGSLRSLAPVAPHLLSLDGAPIISRPRRR